MGLLVGENLLLALQMAESSSPSSLMSDMTLLLAAFLGPLLVECAPDAMKQLHCRSSANEKQKQSTDHEQTKITS